MEGEVGGLLESRVCRELVGNGVEINFGDFNDWAMLRGNLN